MFKKLVCLALTGVMLFGEGTAFGSFGGGLGAERVSADETTVITSLDYYDSANGASHTASGVKDVSFGFVLPKFNGKPSQELSLADVQNDLELQVYVDGAWTNIDDIPAFQFNSNWGWEYQVWSDTANGWICWFKLNETTRLRFHGITNDVNLEYTLTVNKLDTFPVTSLGCKTPEIKADPTGGAAIDWSNVIFNGNDAIKYAQVEEDLELLVDNNDGKGFVPLLANAESGFIWDNNFGIYAEGNGGIWFKNIDWSFTVRIQKKDTPNIYTDVKFTYTAPDRTNTTLTPHDGTTFNANDAANNVASLAIVLPKINGTEAVKSDLDRFVYEVCDGAIYADGKWSGGEWVALSDSSNWIYQDSGYNNYSAQQQWGYFADYVFGLWFQPVRDNTYLRIGYKEESGEVRDNNWIYYTFIGNPNAKFPDVSDMTPIVVDNEGEPSGDVTSVEVPEGWQLLWNDEFNGNTVDDSKWSNQTGFFIDENDYTTSGWGNKELEYYTDSPENTSVADGKLKLTLKKDPKTFYDTQNRPAEALYSSGKLISQNKFSVKYGRVDFRAKLPAGNGIWPALWMMPNDDIYGGWAMSGEIDVFEGRGRTPEIAYGTLHYGSVWPGDLESGDKMNMNNTEGVGSDMTNWHVYSLVWEEGNIKMYVDGICYMKRKADSWNSAGAPNNPNAPFDQRFYLIMNLAAGGYFDGLISPDFDTFTSTDMYVDYVRVYQRQVEEGEDEKNDTNEGMTTNGVDDGLYGDYKIGKVIPATGLTLNKETLSLSAGASETLTATVEPANATNKSITWTSSDESVATVKNGVVKALKTGSATITAKLGDFTKTCAVTVTGTNVTGISLDKTTLALNVGETGKLKATVSPADASNKGVIWSSSDKAVATVAEDGTVKAVKAGETTITATAEGGNFTASCKVTVTKQIIPVASISLNKSTLSLKMGSSETLTAQVLPQDADNKSVVWSSSNERVATVDGGKVTALKMGEVVITATTVDGAKQAQCAVTVTDSGSASGEREATGCEIKDGNIIIYESVNNLIFHKFIDSEDEEINTAQVGADSTVQNGEYWEHVITNGAEAYADKYLAYWFNVSPTPVVIKVSDIPNADAPALTKYTIKFYQQNTSLDGYDLVATEIESGTSGTEVAPEPVSYTGFTLNQEAPGTKTSGIIAEGDSLELAFYYDRNAYKYTYVYNNDSADKEGNYIFGVGVASLEIPVREGYTFDGWYTEASFVTKVTEITGLSTGDVTLYAKWTKDEEKPEPGTYTGRGASYKDGKLTFYVADPAEGMTGAKVYYKVYASKDEALAGSGSIDIDDMKQTELTYDAEAGCWSATVEEELTEENYLLYAFDFEGGAEEGIGDWNIVSGSIAASGQVTAASYLVEHYQQDVSGNTYTRMLVETKKGIAGATVSAASKNYTGFTYNAAAAEGKASGEVAADGSLILKLYYDRNEYPISYNLNGGTQNTANPSSYVYGVGVAELKVPTRSGYRFGGWYTAADFAGSEIVGIPASQTGAVSVYAKWIEDNSGKVNAKAPIISVNPVSKSYVYMQTATVSVAAASADGGTLSYQWYRNTVNSTAGATAIGGATSASYTVPTTAAGITYYFCVVTNTNNNVTGSRTATASSKIAAITVTKAANSITGVSSKYIKKRKDKAFTLKAKGEGGITYTSSNKKVAVVDSTSGKVTIKGYGRTTITIQAAGNANYAAAIRKVTIDVAPTTSLKKVQSKKSRTMVVTWTKDKNAGGYQVQYSTDKKFKKNVKTKKVRKSAAGLIVKKLTGKKTYYVRIRAFKKVGKTTVCSNWSKVKKVKVKK